MIAVVVIIVLATLALGGLGVMASAPSWPLPADTLAAYGGYALALVAAMGVLILLVMLAHQQRLQQRALTRSLELQQAQQRGLETTQLMERFVHQAELLLERESLDPNKRSVLRCLSIDALRGNTGRGDPNYHRLARLFEWLAQEAEAAGQDPVRQRLMEPVLRQYAEIADQLCHVGEADPTRLEPFLRFQPQARPEAERTEA
ncbi:hypothetical protein [Modicisalibacter tunisiensis]|uniref:DUF4760 domain-containing protein n=1 Tax=Modicisalibacter tunisiensis TaxID=390637 RepID=A0ABS7X3K2_9GAMM|nr:hypothetical protein [Modicisalibacter tunisiensis]MBZ9537386.1 hypothetical protein [Modicisalibacter tunisiensis]MBZ9569190.1 hypothetical protein [Modicisalibacter tunisiensis]